jgi:uncharacterized membrane protein
MYLPRATILAAFEFEGVNHAWLWLLLIAAGGWAMFHTYRSIAERSQPRIAWSLLALRAAGLIALLLALSKPTWTDEEELVDPGRLAVVLDDSLSMSLEGRYAKALTAIEQLRSDLRSSSDGPAVEVDVFDLSGQLLEEIPDAPRAERSDLQLGLTQAVTRLRSRPLVGVVLISDGVDNTGRTDNLRLAELPVPVYTIAYQSDPDASQLDLEVRPPTTIEKVIVNNKVKVSVPIVKSAGGEITATVSIRRGSDVEITQDVTLGDGDVQQTVDLTFTPAQIGSFVYTATVETDNGERLLANNARHFPLEVEGDSIRVLYVEGFLRFEYRYLKSRLVDDPDVDPLTLVRRANPDRTDETRPHISAERLEKTDLVILGDMDGDFLSPAEYELLTSWLESGKALLVLGGYRSFSEGGFVSTPLAGVLPVVFAKQEPRQSEEPFTFELTAVGRQHPIFEVTGDRVKDVAMWNSTPPLLGCGLVQRAKDGAEVLAVNPGVEVDGEPAVVIAMGRYGSGRTMVITADTTWRWTRLTRVVGRSDTLYSRFWSQTVRWLTGRELEQRQARLVVSTDKPDYKVGREVRIRAIRGSDSDTAGEVTVEVTDEAGQRFPIPVKSNSAEPDTFVGSFYPSAGGRYRIDAGLESGGELQANQEADFIVFGSELELADTGTNPGLLKSIADRTGGVSVDIANVSELSSRIERRERRYSRVERTEYWNSSWLFLFFLATVSSEWVIRRKQRMV